MEPSLEPREYQYCERHDLPYLTDCCPACKDDYADWMLDLERER